MVDRFHDSDGQVDEVAGATPGDATSGPSGQYHGGDLAGVTEKMPYLADLGVTAVWLSAPYDNRDTAGAAIDPGADPHTYSGYHGYWPKPQNTDFSDMANPSPRPQGRVAYRHGAGPARLGGDGAWHHWCRRSRHEGALRLRDEPRGQREPALPGAQRLVRAQAGQLDSAMRPRESLGRPVLGYPLCLHGLPAALRLRQRRRARLVRERRHLVGEGVWHRRLPPRRHQTRAARVASGTCARASTASLPRQREIAFTSWERPSPTTIATC